MICRKCNRQFEGRFCPYCGTQAPQRKRKGPPPKSPRPGNPNRRWWVLLVVLGIVLAAAAAGLAWRFWGPQDRSDTAVFCPDGSRHRFRTETVQADCTQRGCTTGTCKKCGYTYMDNMVNALGHDWQDAVSVRPLSCTQDGQQSRSCSRCGITREEPLVHSGHDYQISEPEDGGTGETVEYVCTACGDRIVRSWDDQPLRELKEKTFLPDRGEDFTFLVSCDGGEAYLLENLEVTGEDGPVAYHVTAESDGVYRVAAEEPYEPYGTYHAHPAEGLTFPEYSAAALEFTIAGPDRAQVAFNEDNLVFLKALELEQYDASGRYELQWDEGAQRYYLTMFQMEDMDPSLIGKVIGIGDYVSTEEILLDSNRQLRFAKLERITHDGQGQLLLELSVPELSEVYDELDFYFAGGSADLAVSGDPEAAFMDAVVNSEGFAEYVTAVHLAAEAFARDHGLTVTPLAETSDDNLKFQLTKHSFVKTADDNACKLELGGKITYTIPLKNEGGHVSGSVTLACNAEISSYISAGGHYKDADSVNLYLSNSTASTLGFEMAFKLEYSRSYENQYLVHKTTHTIHTSTCRIANNETDSANLQKMTAQELSEMYNGDKEVMKHNECKVCLAVTGLDGTAYVYNNNTGVLHCMNCRHVEKIDQCNLYTLYPDNTLSFTTCADCRPETRQTQDFNNRMLNAIKGSDWEKEVTSFRKMLGDSVGKKKPPMGSDPNLTVPINVAGVFNIEIGVAPVFDFDMQASVNFTITADTTNEYGIRSVGEGFETYHNEFPGGVDYSLKFTGEATAKFGIAMIIKAYPVGCEDFACVAINGQVGLYGRLMGIFAVEGSLGDDADVYCAARMEVGLYAKISGYWKILWFDGNFNILKEQRLPLFKWGYDRVYYAFEDEQVEWTTDDPDEFVMFNLPGLMKAKYLDLTTMKYGTQLISPVSRSRLEAAVEITNEDGSPCDFLEYIPENGMVHKKANAPETFTAVITVRITPKVRIDTLADFLASESDEVLCGYSMDPLVVTLKVEERQEPVRTTGYNEILDMYYAGISSQWANLDGQGLDTVGDPDNVCYMLPHFHSEWTLSQVGYALLDINNDRQPELFVSLMDDAADGGIFDMYTMVNGRVVHVISAGERDRYQLAAGYSIDNHGSSGAASSVHINYRLDPASGALRVNEAVIYDGWEDEANPWFYANTDFVDPETYEYNYNLLTPVSEDEAMALLDRFPAKTALPLVPFDSYVPGSGGAAEGGTGAFRGTIQEFLDRKGYQPFWNEAFADGSVQPSEYGVFDMDQDGNEELLVCGYEYGREWVSYLLFEYSASGNEVTLVQTELPANYEFSPGYAYMLDRYSPAMRALVIEPLRSTQMTAIFEFWTKDNGRLKHLMDVGWDTDEGGRYYFANGQRCTEGLKDQYLNNETVMISFQPLP